MVFEIGLNGEIASYAWSNTSYEAMLVYMAVESSIDINDAVDRFPIDVDLMTVQIELDSANAATPVMPAAFNLGLYANDPLQVVVDTLEDAGALLSPLEEAGHAATGSIGGSKIGPPSPADDDCLRVVADFIGSIVIAAEEHDQGIATFMDSFQSAMQSSGNSNCDVCTEVTDIDTGEWETTCGSWMPSSAGIQTLANCMGRRHFTRSVTSMRTITYTRVCEDCTVLQCEKTVTRSMTDREYGPSFDMSQWACNRELVPGNVGDPPAGVACEITWFDMHFGDVDETTHDPDNCALADLVCP